MKFAISACRLIPTVTAIILFACAGEAPPTDQVNTVFPGNPEVDIFLSITDSIGVETGDSSFVFGQLVTTVKLENGNTAVLDMMKCRVSIFDGNGNFLKSFGGEGSGPGEFLMPAWLSVTPSGCFVVSDAVARRLIFFDSQANYTGYMGNFFPSPPLMAVFLNDSVFVARSTVYETDHEEILAGFEIARWNVGDFEEQVVYFSNLKPFDLMNLGESEAGQPLFTVSTDGMVYTSTLSTDRFLINCWTPEGEALFTIEEPYTPVERSAEAIEAEREYIHGLLMRNGAPADMVESIQPEEYEYAITSLDLGPGGLLWVGTGVYGYPFFRIYEPHTGELVYTAALDNPENFGEISVSICPWGITAVNSMSDEWPRVYLLDTTLL